MAEVPHNPMEGSRPELKIDLQEGSEEQVSIIIVHKDRPEYLNALLQSLLITTSNNNVEIIISDNASGQATQDFLDEIDKDIKVVRNKENLWFSEAANRGAEAADKNSKYLVFLHHDVIILSPSWLDMLINVSTGKQSGMVGVDMSSYFMQNTKVDFIQEWCLLMTRECWEKVGPWPKELPQVGNAFIFTTRAQRLGFNPQVMKNSIVHHYRVFAMNISEYERMVESAMVTIPKFLKDMYSQPITGN